MALMLWPLLLAIPLSLVRAGPLSTTSLTPFLSTVVPECAQSCLLAFIANNYPIQVCTADNFNCLCIKPTTSSYTIGEGAHMCLLSTASCSNQDKSYDQKVYDVCGAIPDAQRNTHSKLTISSTSATTKSARESSSTTRSFTATTKSSILSSSTSPNLTTSSTASGIVTAKASNTTSLSSSTNISSTFNLPTNTNPPSITSTISPTASASSPTSSATSSVLTKPQLAGVIVASIGAAALAFGLCLLLICCRRRQAHRRRPSDNSFIGDKTMGSRGSTPDPAAIVEKDSGATRTAPSAKSSLRPPLTVVPPSRTNQGEWREWTTSTNPSPRNIGLALGPDLSHSAKEGPSPITPGSYGTDSQLLPEMPTTYSLFPVPPRTGPNSRGISQTVKPPIPPYAPERSPPMNGPRFPSSVDTSQAYLQGNSRQRSLSDPFYDIPKRSSLQGYRGVPFTDQRAIITRPGDAPPTSEHYNTSPTSTRSKQSTLSRTYLPPLPSEQHYLASIERSRNRKYPSRKKSTNSSQRTRSTRFSTGSETSFEEVDEDEFPVPRSALSPVAEKRSPPQTTSRAIYSPVPHIPAKSHQRTINRPQPPHQNESLAAKRRGEDKAAELASTLQGKKDVTQTAKWKILVSPGLESLDSAISGSPHTARSAERTPPIRQTRSPTTGW